MKNFLAALLVVVLLPIVIFFSCKRDKDCDHCMINQPPVARAGDDFTVSLPNVNVVLDGGNSVDLNGKIVKWLWTKISGPDPHEIVTKDSVRTFLRNVVEGIYRFQLEVTDNGGLVAKDTMQLSVLPQNFPPKAVAGADVSIALLYCGARAVVNLDGSASSDPDNNISNYLWKKISGPDARLLAITTTNLRVEEMIGGVYSFELSVVDTRGLESKDTVIVQITSPAPTPYDIDVTTSGDYVFQDNFKYCYYDYDCYYNDILEFAGKVNLSSTIFDIAFTDYSDSARTVYAQSSYVAIYSGPENKNVYGQCSVNFKKLLQDGGGPFTGTLKIAGGSADQCVPNILAGLPLLSVSGNLDTSTKRLTLTVKGKLYF